MEHGASRVPDPVTCSAASVGLSPMRSAARPTMSEDFHFLDATPDQRVIEDPVGRCRGKLQRLRSGASAGRGGDAGEASAERLLSCATRQCRRLTRLSGPHGDVCRIWQRPDENPSAVMARFAAGAHNASEIFDRSGSPVR
jgi:hypothetical protein